MTNLPFGFNLGGNDEPGDGSGGSGQGDGGRDDAVAGRGGQQPGPAGAGASGFGGGMPGGFDMTQLGEMISQLGRMMSESGNQSGPVNYQMAQKLALQAIPSAHPASSVDVAKVKDAVNLAEIWLDGVTGFPAAATTITAWSPQEWVKATMPSWQELCTPVAERVSGAWAEALPQEMQAQVGPLLGMLTSMGSMSYGSQIGQGLAQLAGEVLTSTDVGLPLGPAGTAALLPTSMAQFAQGLSVDEDQARLYLAAREAAHHRLYAGAPWLRKRVLALVREYADGISVDFSEMERLAGQIDPSDPAAMQELMAGGEQLMKPTITAGQQAALRQLETLLALVEGWVDTVVSAAVGDRLPSASALQETMRRRRASGGPSEQTFASLVGLQLRPTRLRAAADLWRAVDASRGQDGRDALWGHPDLLPSTDDLDDPKGFIERDREFSELLAGLADVASLPDDENGAGDDRAEGSETAKGEPSGTDDTDRDVSGATGAAADPSDTVERDSSGGAEADSSGTGRRPGPADTDDTDEQRHGGATG